MASIKVSSKVMDAVCDRIQEEAWVYNYLSPSEKDRITLIQCMANAVESTAYSYVILDMDDFDLLKDYL